MKRNECQDLFLRGYLDAALFTTDPEPGAGDYVGSGRADEMFLKLPASFVERAKIDCFRFQADNAELLKRAGNDEQNGTNFWYTRNGHGVGFWDMDYDDDVSDTLTESARAFGESYLMAEALV